LAGGPRSSNRGGGAAAAVEEEFLPSPPPRKLFSSLDDKSRFRYTGRGLTAGKSRTGKGTGAGAGIESGLTLSPTEKMSGMRRASR